MTANQLQSEHIEFLLQILQGHSFDSPEFGKKISYKPNAVLIDGEPFGENKLSELLEQIAAPEQPAQPEPSADANEAPTNESDPLLAVTKKSAFGQRLVGARARKLGTQKVTTDSRRVWGARAQLS